MLYPILIFIFGTIIGSFLNVVILRYNSGMSLGGRSGCFSCGKPLTWKELIPLLSFFYQRRKCVGCGSAISWQYPAVEALTGLSFVLIFYKYFGNDLILSAERVSSALIYAVIFCLLIVIAVYDMRHKIIPNGPVYLFITLSFVSTILFPLFFNTFSFQPITILAGPALFLPFFILWFMSGGTWMGFGDAKIALGIGWLFGLAQGFTALVLAFYIGAAFGLSAIAAEKVISKLRTVRGLNINSKRLTMKSEIPFGPFLILGVYLVFIFNFNFFNF